MTFDPKKLYAYCGENKWLDVSTIEDKLVELEERIKKLEKKELEK